MPRNTSSKSSSRCNNSSCSGCKRRSKPPKSTKLRHKADHRFDSKFVTKKDKGKCIDFDFTWTNSISQTFDYDVKIDLDKWKPDRLKKYESKNKSKPKSKKNSHK